MKKILFYSLMLLYTFAGLNAQTAPSEVCTSPTSYNYDDEVTWYFDLSGNTEVTPGQDLYFWSWEPQELPNGPALMSYENNMSWSLTMTATDLYGLTVSEIETAGNSAFWSTIIDGPQSGVANSVTGTIPYNLKEKLRLGSSCSFNATCNSTPSTSDNTFLVNFGDEITNPDTNTNYWTNVNVKDVSYELKDKSGVSRYKIEASGNFIKYSSPSGFNTPDTNILDEMAIPLATSSYMYLTAGKGVVSISCLEPSRMYRLSIFGSRNTASTRETKYTIVGENTTSGVLQTSGQGIATDTNLNANDDEFYVAEMFPNTEGKIDIETEIYSGNFGYLNMMKIEEVINPTVINVTSISINTNNISTSGPSKLSIDFTPSNTTQTGINWSVNDENIAIIDNEGNLKPKQAGTITVTAASSSNSSISDQVNVTFSNLITDLYIVGLATEAGNDLAESAIEMKRVSNAEGTVTNQFELYTSMSATGDFRFLSATGGSGSEFGGNGSGSLLAGTGNPITSPGGGWKYVLVDFNEMTYSVTPMYGWNVISNMITKEAGQEAWWGGAENLSNYEGNSVWSGTVNFSEATNADDSPRFYLELAGTGRAIKQIKDTENSLVFVDKANGVDYTDIYNFNGEYNITVDLKNFTYTVNNTCSSIDNMKISIMGSSVGKGFGASVANDDSSQYMGYAHQYDLLLRDRANNSIGENWMFSNISIGGDKTTNLLNRYDNHLLTDCSKYVVYALSLANEGVFSTGQAAFDQFETNMEALIQKAKDDGKIPVVIGNYANGNFTNTQYEFIKNMNLLIHKWDIPSVNVMGAIDDGTGKWVAGHSTDPGHPNELGYKEMMHAIVPSLFDALHAEKSQPQLVSGTFMSLGSQVNKKLTVTPEEEVHSFTTSFEFKTSGQGAILEINNATNSGNIIINSSGNLIYSSPITGQITGSEIVNNDTWHTITLTHFYARGETILYFDGIEEGQLAEKFLLSDTSINSGTVPSAIDYRNLFFYRSGMNQEEVTRLNAGDLLKSSLEIYAPLDGQQIVGNDALVNLAQSTNTLVEEANTLSTQDEIKKTGSFKVFPNPSKNNVFFQYNIKESSSVEITLYNLIGTKVGQYSNKNQTSGDYRLSLSDLANKKSLSKGVYLCRFKTTSFIQTVKMILE
ncbi:MAG: lysophospholipase L1-like esterase [Polaribacter sp.]|jgi:lysophospholipase L1-like esterase